MWTKTKHIIYNYIDKVQNTKSNLINYIINYYDIKRKKNISKEFVIFLKTIITRLSQANIIIVHFNYNNILISWNQIVKTKLLIYLNTINKIIYQYFDGK